MRQTLLVAALSSAVSFLVGFAVAGQTGSAPPVQASQAPAVAKAVPARATGGALPGAVNFADVAERINPAVVNIDAASRGGRSRRRRPGDDSGDQSHDFDLPRQGSGSGFIIDRQGFILTNYHVIEEADRITVTLADGRVLKGEVVGTDPAIDVALLKVNASGSLPEAPLGNSDELRVGEWVCAIGNPLGYVHSVTVGVVSFIGRKLFDASLDDYIQTDAAINLGNSGGPLIDARGEVIGINSAISSRATNIGFAVPINQAVAILPQLKTKGHVSRGFLGVVLTDVTPDLQRALNLTVSRGALVQDVNDDSPAMRAGLRAVRRHPDGRRPRGVDQRGTDPRYLRAPARHDRAARRPARRPPRRDGREAHRAPAGERSGRCDRAGRSTRDRRLAFGPAARASRPRPRSALVRRLDVPSSVHGVVVTRVDPAGPAFVPALRRGFIVMEINRQPVQGPGDFQRIVSAARVGDALAFYGYDPSVGQRAILTATVDAR